MKDERHPHPPAAFGVYADGELLAGELFDYDGPERLQFECLDNSNGGNMTTGPLSWLNRAAVQLDPEHDAIQLSASVGDPRGAFCIEIRRTADGRILLHFPHPGEALPHMTTRELHPGTLEIVCDNRPLHFTRHESPDCADCGNSVWQFSELDSCPDCDGEPWPELCADCQADRDFDAAHDDEAEA